MRKGLLPILTSMVLLVSAEISWGQGLNLGTAGRFSVFTAVGAFTNEGATTVTGGDIGTNAGMFSGFPPGMTTGQIQVANTITAQAATDVDVAYTAASQITCGVVLGATLGNGQVLSPNVYCIGSDATLTGTLVLDGNGDPNAVFVLKIDGTFSTTPLSTVSLINGASCDRVYVQVNGAVSLETNSEFRGIILTNGAINLRAGASLRGKALSRAGAVSLHTNTITAVPTPVLISQTICAGQSAQLTVADCAGAVRWSANAGDMTSPTVLVMPTATTVYSVSCTVGGCTGTASATVAVQPVPTLQVTASPAGVIQIGQAVTLTADGCADGTLTWSAGAGNTGQTSVLVVPSQPTTDYAVTCTTAANCTTTVSITLLAVPAAATRLGGYVFSDTNGNGTPDPDDSPIPTATITLLTSGTVVTTTTTDANGLYSFTGLTAGTPYSISVAVPSGYAGTTTPATTTVYSLTVGEGVTANVGFLPSPTVSGSIGGAVWSDLNRDGAYGPGQESGVPGVTVRLLAVTVPVGTSVVSTSVVSTTQTDASGRYVFANLSAGQYSLEFDRSTFPVDYAITPDYQKPGVGSDVNSDADPVTGRTAVLEVVPTDLTRRDFLEIGAGLVNIGCPPAPCVLILSRRLR